jgi:predicted RNase H-like HicB family nuclease
MSGFQIVSAPAIEYAARMRNRYTAVVQRDGEWFVAFCPEVPEANGQGKRREDCLESLAAAIDLVLNYRREQSLEKAPRGAEQTSILV